MSQRIAAHDIVGSLGSGAQADVHLGTHPETGETVAIKIYKQPFTKDQLTEWKNMIRLNHPNVLKIMSSSTEVINGEAKGVAVLEYCPHGELLDFIALRKFSEPVSRYFFRQLIEGLRYINEIGCVSHRDLKPDNLLLSSFFDLKLADFGHSKCYEDMVDGKTTTRRGTENYLAPEVFFNKVYNPMVSDIFSTGVILFIMLIGAPPF